MQNRQEIVAFLALAALLSSIAGLAVRAQDAKRAPAETRAVLELFTSQGCSSCPTADALLNQYSDLPGVIALSLSVDYWDHLGWKDTLASPKNTLRQKAYVKALGSGNIYTPQMIVNGVLQTVGSDPVEIDKAIKRTAKEGLAPMSLVHVVNDGQRVTIDVAGAPAGETYTSGTIWVVTVSPRVDVEVKRGENRGKVLTYHNVVREWTPVGMWSGKPMRVELPTNAVTETGNRCAVLVQAGEGGRIVAASWMSPKDIPR